jgi:NADH:ubiquinone oxidoreductase subunit F (NADH-binding)
MTLTTVRPELVTSRAADNSAASIPELPGTTPTLLRATPALLGTTRLLAGPPGAAGAESLRDHRARLGTLLRSAATELVPVLEASGLLGRGGASFPVGRKWQSVAERSDGHAVVLVNGAEGEPLSTKDRSLMALRPHLVIDGAVLAADAVGADEIVLYVGAEHAAARAGLTRALGERSRELAIPIRLVAAPVGYVSGEESAAVHFVNAGDARPTNVPPRPFERGVHGQPTLVQNVESLAQVALIARFGDTWYREAGYAETPGTALMTIAGAVSRPGVREIQIGTPLSEVAAGAGASRDQARAVLLGGYFGGWAGVDEAWDLPLDPVVMRPRGFAFGCGVVSFMSTAECGVTATGRVLDFMARGSAGQCGPCVFGLRAIADATHRLATGTAQPDDLARLERWSGEIAGRGACRHPDGAVGFLRSGLRVFGDDFVRHQQRRACEAHPATGTN